MRIDRKTGDYDTFRQWRILDDDVELMEHPEKEVLFSRVKDEHPDKQIGDYLYEQIESIKFGRIAVQAAKQVIVQKVREAERGQVVELYKDRIGEMLSGVVKRMDRGNIIVDVIAPDISNSCCDFVVNNISVQQFLKFFSLLKLVYVFKMTF